jgi:hypothetical protein
MSAQANEPRAQVKSRLDASVSQALALLKAMRFAVDAQATGSAHYHDHHDNTLARWWPLTAAVLDKLRAVYELSGDAFPDPVELTGAVRVIEALDAALWDGGLAGEILLSAEEIMHLLREAEDKTRAAWAEFEASSVAADGAQARVEAAV